MTRAKSKPSIPSRVTPRLGRPAASNAKPNPPAHRASQGSASTKGKAAAQPTPQPKSGESAVPSKGLPSAKAASKNVPLNAKPVAAKPVAAKPVAAKPVAAKPVAAKPVAAKPVAAKSVTAKPVTAKPVAAKPKASGKPVTAAKVAPAKAVLVDTPASLRPIEQAVGVSSDAVARRTGKSWAAWFALLDAAGAAELDHKGIVAVLAQRHGVGPWWQQMVTTAYEKARGTDGAQAADEGFQVGVEKVLELPVGKLFRFWSEPAERNKWLADDRFSIHKSTASKSIRARWGRGSSRIDVDFSEKGPSKSQVTVQHRRIETSEAAAQMKAYWAKKLSALEAFTRS